MNFNQIHTIVVHGGTINPDDVFAVAYMQLMKNYLHQDYLQILRVFKLTPEYTAENGYLVVGMGGGQFDGRQKGEDKAKRENGTAYGSFSLVVKAYHTGFMNEDEYEIFDKRFMESLDFDMTMRGGNLLTAMISAFNQPWDSKIDEQNQRFSEAVDAVQILLDAYIESIWSTARAKKVALDATVDGETVYFDKYAPVNKYFVDDENVNFIGSPSKRGGYQIVSVRLRDGENKKLLPEVIRGINMGRNNYNDAGINYCHPRGFMATFRDYETAKRFMDSLLK